MAAVVVEGAVEHQLLVGAGMAAPELLLRRRQRGCFLRVLGCRGQQPERPSRHPVADRGVLRLPDQGLARLGRDRRRQSDTLPRHWRALVWSWRVEARR